MKNIVVSSLIISCFILLILNITFGTYYEGYEPIFNALIFGEFSSRIDMSLFLPNWFGLLPLFSFFSEYLHTAHAYSWAMTVANLFILTSLTCCFLLLYKYEGVPRRYAIIIYMVFLTFFSENLIYVYNMRISFWASVTAYFLIFLIKRYHLSKWAYLPVVVLAMISISARLEIAFTTTLILLVVTFLLQPRLLRAAVLLFFTASAVFGFYKIYQHQVYPQYETLLEIEHAYDDQQRVVPSESKDLKTKLLLTAMGSYIWDDDVFTMTDCARIVQNPSLYSYVRSKNFLKIYIGKIKQLAFLLKDYIGLLILSVLLIVYTLYFFLKRQANFFNAIIRILGLILFMILLLMVLNLLITCPHNFIVVCVLGADLLCLVYLLQLTDKLKIISRMSIVFWVVFQLPITAIHYIHLYNYEQDNLIKAQTIRTILLELHNQKKTIVFNESIQYL